MEIALGFLLLSVIAGGGVLLQPVTLPGACSAAAAKDGCEEREVSGIAEESVQLYPELPTASHEEITWEFHGNSGVSDLLEYKGNKVTFIAPNFTNRVIFHPENVSLQINTTRKSDSGVYVLTIKNGSSQMPIRKFCLSVFDRVHKPELAVISAHLDNEQCNLTLSCSVPGTNRLTYYLYHGAPRISSDMNHQSPGNRSLLNLLVNADSNEKFFTCNASNPASWDVDTVDVKSQCALPATDFFKLIPLWALFTGAGALLIVLLFAISLVCCYKHHRNQRCLKDRVELPLVYEDVNDAHLRKNSNANRRHRDIGTTLYSEIGNIPQQLNGQSHQLPSPTIYAVIHTKPPSIKKQKISPAFIQTVYAQVEAVSPRSKGRQK